jgi:hypothetical protein
MNRYFRLLIFLICTVQAFFTIAFLLQMPFAVQLWPLPDTTPLSFIFISSIFAAAVAATLWSMLSKEYAALVGIALDYVTIFAPTTILVFQIAGSTGSSALVLFGLLCAGMVLFGLVLILWHIRTPVKDTRPMPGLVRGSFLIFVIALIIAGGALVLKTPNILPWRVTPEFSVMVGWFFLGAAAYFTYGLLRPGWFNTAGQLAGFLAYDVILIVPFLQRLPTIAPQFQTSLIIYVIVVIYSGLLAIYYLFINPTTRLWRSHIVAGV